MMMGDGETHPLRGEEMYIQSQNKDTLINFDKFHELFLDRENLRICARYFCLDKKITVVLGEYTELETAQKEYDDILDSLIDEENVAIHEVE